MRNSAVVPLIGVDSAVLHNHAPASLNAMAGNSSPAAVLTSGNAATANAALTAPNTPIAAAYMPMVRIRFILFDSNPVIDGAPVR